MTTTLDLPAHSQTKSTVDSDVTVQSSIHATSVTKMTVDTEGAAHIMSLLTDLYSDPNLAVLREYTSNAYDTHVEAGQTRPVEVTLPSSLNPIFVVQDYGTGMSPETIMDIYSSYGKSTKRQDFNVVGAFGLGCKSALTLTQQFTLISNHKGTKTIAIVSRGADGVGQVSITGTTPTTDPDGTKVSIPIQDTTKFSQNVSRFFMTWKPGTVLVDETEPESIHNENFVELGDGRSMLFRKTNTKNSSFELPKFSVIMGGISYSVDVSKTMEFANRYSYGSKISRAQYLWEYSRQLSVFTEIPIASVDLTPSREAIRYSQRTKDFLSALYDQISTLVGKAAYDDIAAAGSRMEAARRLNVWHYALPVGSSSVKDHVFDSNKAKWKDEIVQISVPAPHTKVRYEKNWSYANSEYVTTARATLGNHVGIVVDEDVFYTVATADIPPSKVKSNLRSYFLHKGADLKDQSILIFDAEPTNPWLTESPRLHRVPLNEIMDGAKAYRKANRGLTPPRTSSTFTYPAVAISNGVATVEDISAKTITSADYFVEQNTMTAMDKYFDSAAYRRNRTEFMSAVATIMGDVRIVFVSSSRSTDALFKRVASRPVYFPEALREKTKATYAAIDPLIRATSSSHGSSDLIMILRAFNKFEKVAGTILDADMRLAVTDASVWLTSRPTSLDAIDQIISYVSIYFDDNGVSAAAQKTHERFAKVAQKYPLISLDDRYSSVLDSTTKVEHAVTYMNAIHKEEGRK